MKEDEGSDSLLIADVDCTAGGKALCNSVGVRGYPSIKYGSPDDLKDYKGGRAFKDLKAHADKIGLSCGPANLDLCDDEKKKKIAEFSALGAEKRAAMIEEKDAENEKLERDFDTFVEGLQMGYEEESDKKAKAEETIKASLALLKLVHKFESSAKKTEL